MIDSVATNGFQFVINSAQSKPITQSSNEFQAVNLQGKLNGGINTPIISNDEELSKSRPRIGKIPTIIITAHYDAFGIAPVIYNLKKRTKI